MQLEHYGGQLFCLSPLGGALCIWLCAGEYHFSSPTVYNLEHRLETLFLYYNVFVISPLCVCVRACACVFDHCRHVECFPTLPTFVSFQSCPHRLWTKGESALRVSIVFEWKICQPCCKTEIFYSPSPYRWFYEALKYPRSHRLVVLNGVAMSVVFFLVRIAVMPSYWASVFATFGTQDFERLGLGAQVAWITSCIALDILNTIWMYKITRGCYKVLTGGGGRKVKGGSEASSSSDGKHVNNHTDWRDVEQRMCRHRHEQGGRLDIQEPHSLSLLL